MSLRPFASSRVELRMRLRIRSDDAEAFINTSIHRGVGGVALTCNRFNGFWAS